MTEVSKSPTATTWDSAGSTLLSIPEQELRDCPDSPEHQAVCLKFVIRRVQQLGFLVPDPLTACQRMACKAVMLAHDTDVLSMFATLLDNYERAREERDQLRASEKQQRHEAGRQERRSASLERRMVQQEKKLADAEYRLEERTQMTHTLRAVAKREAQKARQARSELQRLSEQVRHQQRRAEQELFETKQRLERTDRRLPQPSTAGGGRGRPQPNPKAAATAKPPPPTARHAVGMATELFEAVELPPLNRRPGSPAGGRRDRNLSVPAARQIWYRVPQAGTADNASCDSDAGGLGELSVISLAETIDAPPGCRGSWCLATDSSAACSVATSSVNDGRRGGAGGGGNQDNELCN